MKSNDRIYCVDNQEFDRVTNQEVFRDENNRPYIIEENPPDVIDAYDLSVLYCFMLRRVVQDASGPEVIDAITTREDQTESREYLLSGCLEMNGYFIYEAPKDNEYKRVIEEKYTKFVSTDEKEKSIVELQDIFRYTDMDYTVVQEYIRKWAQAGWGRDHEFYKRVMEAT